MTNHHSCYTYAASGSQNVKRTTHIKPNVSALTYGRWPDWHTRLTWLLLGGLGAGASLAVMLALFGPTLDLVAPIIMGISGREVWSLIIDATLVGSSLLAGGIVGYIQWRLLSD